MKKFLILLFLLFLLNLSLAEGYTFGKRALIISADSTLEKVLLDLGYLTTNYSAENPAEFDIIVDTEYATGMRQYNVSTMFSKFVGGAPEYSEEWYISDEGDVDDGVSLQSINTSSHPIVGAAPLNPTVLTSTTWIAYFTNATTHPFFFDYLYSKPGAINAIMGAAFTADVSKDQNAVFYKQSFVYLGLLRTATVAYWTANATRIFNASVIWLEGDHSSCNPPATGNWNIDSNCTIISENITLDGNLTLFAGASLNLSADSNLSFSDSGQYIFLKQPSVIYIEPGSGN